MLEYLLDAVSDQKMVKICLNHARKEILILWFLSKESDSSPPFALHRFRAECKGVCDNRTLYLYDRPSPLEKCEMVLKRIKVEPSPPGSVSLTRVTIDEFMGDVVNLFSGVSPEDPSFLKRSTLFVFGFINTLPAIKVSDFTNLSKERGSRQLTFRQVGDLKTTLLLICTVKILLDLGEKTEKAWMHHYQY